MSEIKSTSLGLDFEDYMEFVNSVESRFSEHAAKASDAIRWQGQKGMDSSEYEGYVRNNMESRVRFRTPYQHDRDTILYSNSFAALAGKTQMLIGSRASILRTRLTHTLFVSQIAESIGRGLQLNEDLISAIALGHDLGHTPFAHAGEWGLNEWIYNKIGADPRAGRQEKLDIPQTTDINEEVQNVDPTAEMLETAFLVSENENSFDLILSPNKKERRLFLHARQSFKRLTVFEEQNLSKQVLFGIWRHSGSCSADDYKFSYKDNDGKRLNKESLTYEAQVVRLADDIAWVAHDLQDAIQAGLLNISQFARKRMGYIGAEKYTVTEAAGDRSKWIDLFINDAITFNFDQLDKASLKGGEGRQIQLSPAKEELLRNLKEAVYSVHNDEEVNRSNRCAIEVITSLCDHYYEHKNSFVEDLGKVKEKREVAFYDHDYINRNWNSSSRQGNQMLEISRMALICDFVSSLTDEEAVKLHARYFSPEAFIKPIFSL